jgi:hypothetical protein
MSHRRTLRNHVTTRTRERSAFGGVATVFLVGWFWWFGGAPGAAAGLLLGGAWLVLPAPYVVVLGHLALLVFTSEPPDVVQLGLVETGFAGILVGASPSSTEQRRLAGWLFPTGGAVGALGWIMLRRADALWLTTLVVAAVVVLAAYALHRYELARLTRAGEHS